MTFIMSSNSTQIPSLVMSIVTPSPVTTTTPPVTTTPPYELYNIKKEENANIRYMMSYYGY